MRAKVFSEFLIDVVIIKARHGLVPIPKIEGQRKPDNYRPLSERERTREKRKRIRGHNGKVIKTAREQMGQTRALHIERPSALSFLVSTHQANSLDELKKLFDLLARSRLAHSTCRV